MASQVRATWAAVGRPDAVTWRHITRSRTIDELESVLNAPTDATDREMPPGITSTWPHSWNVARTSSCALGINNIFDRIRHRFQRSCGPAISAMGILPQLYDTPRPLCVVSAIGKVLGP